MTVSPQAGSLHQIMNEVSRRLDQPMPLHPVQRAERMCELSAFSQLDPLLSDLRKQYLDARQNRLSAEKDFGKDDAMCEMAALLEDSAWCAMQTRYMEVRADRFMMKQAQALMEEDRRLAEKAEHEHSRREKLEMYHISEMCDRLRKTDQKRQNDFWLLLFWLYVMKDQPILTMARPVYHFNRYAA